MCNVTLPLMIVAILIGFTGCVGRLVPFVELDNKTLTKLREEVIVYDSEQLPNIKYKRLGTIEGYSCMYWEWGPRSSREEAIDQLRYRASALGGSGIASLACTEEGLSLAKNCYNSVTCNAVAIQLEPTGHTPSVASGQALMPTQSTEQGKKQEEKNIDTVRLQDIEQLQAGVVKITAKSSGGALKAGTGFIVRLDRDAAYIVTAAHVVAGDPQPQVEFFTKRNVPVPAEVLPGAEGGDEVRGLALLIVKGKDNIPVGLTQLSLASSSHPSAGQDIMLIGFPRGVGPWAVIKGNISSRQGRDIYFSPTVGEGNSGGPIIQNGKVVGLVGAGGQLIGQGVTARSIEDYIEGFGIATQETASAKAVESHPAPNAQTRPEASETPLDREIIGKDGAPIVLIPAGSFMMGSADGVGGKDERPVHEVRFSKTFAIARYETTFEEYDRFAQATGRELPNDAGFGRGRRPVINVSWEGARDYAAWLSQQTGKHYRLPTEAEWEYAARSGGKNETWAGTSDEKQIADFAVYRGNSQNRTAPVGSKKPNGYSLHDMSGNVREWVEDCWHDSYQGAPKDGTAWGEAGSGNCRGRVIRGGSWSSNPENLRASNRDWDLADYWFTNVGVRLVQDLQ